VKALVTGGAGFIGSHVVDKLLQKGLEVTVLDNLSTGRIENLEHCLEQLKFVQCDLSETGGWQDEFDGCDWVIHLAALADIVPSIQQPEAYFRSNVVGTLNVLQAARTHNISRLVYSASSSCYGMTEVFPTPENATLSPQYPYALTKLLGEELVLHWAKIYRIPALSLRFFNVFGPRSRTSGTYGAVFGVFLAQKLAGKPFTVVGDGLQKRDFTYVSDVAQAVLAACEASASGVAINIGSGAPASVLTLTQLLGGDVTFIPKRPGEPSITFADISLAKEILNWTPRVSFAEGVDLLMKEIDYWRSAIVWTPDSIADATKDWFKYLSD